MSTATLPQTNRSDGRYHWTVDTFYRAVDAGVWDEPKRLELINGELRERDLNPPHALLTEQIYELTRGLFGVRFWVRMEKPFRIAFDGEPMPDIALVDSAVRGLRDRHPRPEEMRLIIEVADATVDHDLGEKARLYAQAGIADYWVALIPDRQVVVFRQPSPSGYPDGIRLGENDVISPLAAPDVQIAVRDLLPPASLRTEVV